MDQVASELHRGVTVSDPIPAGAAELPGGVPAFETARRGEVVYPLPAQRAHGRPVLRGGKRAPERVFQAPSAA